MGGKRVWLALGAAECSEHDAAAGALEKESCHAHEKTFAHPCAATIAKAARVLRVA